MKDSFIKIGRMLVDHGFDPRKMYYAIRGLPSYFRDLFIFKKQFKKGKSTFPFGGLYPCIIDKYLESGTSKGHYFHQDLLVARKIFLNQPDKHVDIGSRIDGFVAHVASFRKIEVFDIREMTSEIPNIKFTRADLMNEIDPSLTSYCDSLSCLHAIEHFGLGRYGDPIRYDGYLLGFNNLYKILKERGTLYFSVPIGPQRIEFNAHRVFSVNYLMQLIENEYAIASFSFVDDKGNLHENVEMNKEEIRNNFGCEYGCGIFELTKL
jgi:hypothetical protein